MTYKSPTAKLLKFFPQSRDRWKAKCQAVRSENKKLANQTRAVEKSREHWKELAKSRLRRIDELEREVQELKPLAAAPG